MGVSRYKKTCIQTICPTDCSSLHYNHSLHRFCYDENYQLKKDCKEHFRINGKDANIITGFVGQEKKKIDNQGMDDYISWEFNMTTIDELITDNWVDVIKDIFDKNKWDFNIFIKQLRKARKEVFND